MTRFLRDLQYSSCSEDSSIELNALSIDNSDHLLCISGSGGRVFDLLLGFPEKVIALDLNPWQIALSKCKSLAMTCLDYDQFLQWLGLKGGPHDSRKMWRIIERSFSRELQEMSPYIHRFERMYPLIYSGKIEKHLKVYAAVMKWGLKDLLVDLFSASGLEEQSKIWGKIIKTKFWRSSLWIGANPSVFRYLLDNWGWYRQSLSHKDVPQLIESKISAFMDKHMLRESHLAQLIFYGRYLDFSSLPLYLQPESFSIIKQNLYKIEFRIQGFLEFIEGYSSKKHLKISGSNIPAYLTDQQRVRMWEVMAQNLPMHSRVCFRGFLNLIEPEQVWSQVSKSLDVQAWQQADKSIMYDLFLAEKVV